MAKSYYDILEVGKGASEKEIRTAYRRLARRYHPDVNRGEADAEARFKKINEAYQVLSDAESRKRYDRYGADWRQAGQHERSGNAGASPFSWFTDARQGSRRGGSRTQGFGSMADIFGDLFAGGGGAEMQDMPRTSRAELLVKVTLEEAYAGTTRRVEAAPNPISGEPGRRLEVTIPAGVFTGSRVHVNAADKAGGSLDVNLKITVAAHRTFERKDDDLLTTVNVALEDAVLGGEIEVPTISSKKVALTVPPETQNGKVFRLKGKGMPRKKGSGHGDLLATVKVVLPVGLSDEQRKFFQQLRDLRGAGV
jgi:DnaJ-class molecular chaperone